MPPLSGIRPIAEKLWMNLADLAATTRSQASAILAPAPAATPLTRAITGWGSAVSVRISGFQLASTVSPRSTASPGATARSLRSCPAQKPRPAPVRISDPRIAEVGQRVAQLAVHLRGEAVEPVGAVERDPGDAALSLEVDGLVSHAAGLAKEGAWTQTNSQTRVAQAMLAAEGTGPAWGIGIEEAREGYARVSMRLRADMLNGHGIAHGGMIFALADTAFAYVCNGANHAAVAAQARSCSSARRRKAKH